MLQKTLMSGEHPSSEITRFRSISPSQKVRAVLRLLEGTAPEELAR
jgi:hypothetical protein